MIARLIDNAAMVRAVLGAIVLSGLVASHRLELARSTAIEYPRLDVTARWEHASPELVETYVSAPIEAAVQGIRGVRGTASVSSEGLSTVSVTLAADANVPLTRLAILERLGTLADQKLFPSRVSRPIVSDYVPDALREAPLVTLAVSGSYAPPALSKAINEILVPRLSATAGVATVQTSSDREQGVLVTYDPSVLDHIGVAPMALADAIRNSRLVRALGHYPDLLQSRPVVLRNSVQTIEELRALPVGASGGGVFRLGAIATIGIGSSDHDAFTRIDGVPAITVYVSRQAAADAIATSKRVREAIKSARPLLPAALHLTIVTDEGSSVAMRLRSLSVRSGVGLTAATIVLVLAMRSLAGALFVVASSLLAIAGTGLSLFILKVPVNIVTLSGLSMGLGILMQDAVVLLDRLARVPSGGDRRVEAARRALPAIISATLTTVVVLGPFLYLQGSARAAFVPFALAFAIALIWSALSSLALLSLTTHRRLRRPRSTAIPRRWVLRGALSHGRTVLVLSAAGAVATAWYFVRRVPRESWRGFGDERTQIFVNLSMPRGSAPETVARTIGIFESIALAAPGVEHVQVIGRENYARMAVTFPREEEPVIPLALYSQLKARSVALAGATIAIEASGASFASGGGSAVTFFYIGVRGYSYEGVKRLASDIQQRLELIPRVHDVRIQSSRYSMQEAGATVVTLRPRRALLARMNIPMSTVANAINQEIGATAAQFSATIAGEEVPLILRSANAASHDLRTLGRAFIVGARNTDATIAEVANITDEDVTSSIQRDKQRYVRVVAYEFGGPPKLAARIHQQFLRSVSPPAGYEILDETTIRGSEDVNADRLPRVFLIGLVLIGVVVAAIYNSVWAAAMLLLTLPISGVGIMLAFILAHATFTREAAVGAILVLGLASRQSLLVIDAAAARRRPNIARSGAACVYRLAHDQAGVVITSALASLATLVPIAVTWSTNEPFAAIALSAAGGTAAALIAALVVLPVLIATTMSWSGLLPRGESARMLGRESVDGVGLN
jgi:HAE1 family hydrophobic/amphiphilic exporter-1